MCLCLAASPRRANHSPSISGHSCRNHVSHFSAGQPDTNTYTAILVGHTHQITYIHVMCSTAYIYTAVSCLTDRSRCLFGGDRQTDRQTERQRDTQIGLCAALHALTNHWMEKKMAGRQAGRQPLPSLSPSSRCTHLITHSLCTNPAAPPPSHPHISP